MPMPHTYRHATREWRAFLADAKDQMALQSDNNTYTAVQGVLLTFRRRLTVPEALLFADVLPSVLRAMFVYQWDVSQPPLDFIDRKEMTAEVKNLRKDHNLTPDNAIEATAWAMWRAINHREFNLVLSKLPKPAQAFWHVDVKDPTEIAHRLV